MKNSGSSKKTVTLGGASKVEGYYSPDASSTIPNIMKGNKGSICTATNIVKGTCTATSHSKDHKKRLSSKGISTKGETIINDPFLFLDMPETESNSIAMKIYGIPKDSLPLSPMTIHERLSNCGTGGGDITSIATGGGDTNKTENNYKKGSIVVGAGRPHADVHHGGKRGSTISGVNTNKKKQLDISREAVHKNDHDLHENFQDIMSKIKTNPYTVIEGNTDTIRHMDTETLKRARKSHGNLPGLRPGFGTGSESMSTGAFGGAMNKISEEFDSTKGYSSQKTKIGASRMAQFSSAQKRFSGPLPPPQELQFQTSDNIGDLLEEVIDDCDDGGFAAGARSAKNLRASVPAEGATGERLEERKNRATVGSVQEMSPHSFVQGMSSPLSKETARGSPGGKNYDRADSRGEYILPGEDVDDETLARMGHATQGTRRSQFFLTQKFVSGSSPVKKKQGRLDLDISIPVSPSRGLGNVTKSFFAGGITPGHGMLMQNESQRYIKQMHSIANLGGTPIGSSGTFASKWLSPQEKLQLQHQIATPKATEGRKNQLRATLGQQGQYAHLLGDKQLATNGSMGPALRQAGTVKEIKKKERKHKLHKGGVVPSELMRDCTIPSCFGRRHYSALDDDIEIGIILSDTGDRLKMKVHQDIPISAPRTPESKKRDRFLTYWGYGAEDAGYEGERNVTGKPGEIMKNLNGRWADFGPDEPRYDRYGFHMGRLEVADDASEGLSDGNEMWDGPVGRNISEGQNGIPEGENKEETELLKVLYKTQGFGPRHGFLKYLKTKPPGFENRASSEPPRGDANGKRGSTTMSTKDGDGKRGSTSISTKDGNKRNSTRRGSNVRRRASSGRRPSMGREVSGRKSSKRSRSKGSATGSDAEELDSRYKDPNIRRPNVARGGGMCQTTRCVGSPTKKELREGKLLGSKMQDKDYQSAGITPLPFPINSVTVDLLQMDAEQTSKLSSHAEACAITGEKCLKGEIAKLTGFSRDTMRLLHPYSKMSMSGVHSLGDIGIWHGQTLQLVNFKPPTGSKLYNPVDSTPLTDKQRFEVGKWLPKLSSSLRKGRSTRDDESIKTQAALQKAADPYTVCPRFNYDSPVMKFADEKRTAVSDLGDQTVWFPPMKDTKGNDIAVIHNIRETFEKSRDYMEKTQSSFSSTEKLQQVLRVSFGQQLSLLQSFKAWKDYHTLRSKQRRDFHEDIKGAK